jgi:hypothetical protein
MFIGSLDKKIVWRKYKNGIYVTNHKNYIVIIEQINDKSLQLNRWWYTFIVDPKTKETIQELEPYISLTEAKRSMISNFDYWYKAK